MPNLKYVKSEASNWPTGWEKPLKYNCVIHSHGNGSSKFPGRTGSLIPPKFVH